MKQREVFLPKLMFGLVWFVLCWYHFVSIMSKCCFFPLSFSDLLFSDSVHQPFLKLFLFYFKISYIIF